jgi:hypothetical protein
MPQKVVIVHGGRSGRLSSTLLSALLMVHKEDRDETILCTLPEHEPPQTYLLSAPGKDTHEKDLDKSFNKHPRPSLRGWGLEYRVMRKMKSLEVCAHRTQGMTRRSRRRN